jgi:hypothetical protein
MIHHISIPATEPLKVAQVLARLLGGDVSRFGPYLGSYIAWARDEAGTAIEVYPVGTEMFPDTGKGQANFRHNPGSSGFTATHVAISLNRTEDEIKAIAQVEGWRAIRLPRGGFDVIEFWVENRVMFEILTPEMAADYLRATRY